MFLSTVLILTECSKEAPAEFIIASITAFIGYYTCSLVIPFAHRFGRKITLMTVVLFTALSITTMGMMSMKSPFDAMHPRRMFVIQSENVRVLIKVRDHVIILTMNILL